MKFAHLADCHIGAWRDPKLRDVSIKAFVKAIDTCIDQHMDFILIAGDLFNTSLPSVASTVTRVPRVTERLPAATSRTAMVPEGPIRVRQGLTPQAMSRMLPL